MASDSKDEKAELEAVAVIGTGEAGAAGGGPAPPPSGDSPKPHGDKLAVPVGRAAGHRRKVTLGEPEDPDEQ